MRTAKAYAAAFATALGAVLTTTTPFLDGTAARWAYAVLAVLAALGITYRVPNAPAGSHGGGGGILDVIPPILAGSILPRGRGADLPPEPRDPAPGVYNPEQGS